MPMQNYVKMTPSDIVLTQCNLSKDDYMQLNGVTLESNPQIYGLTKSPVCTNEQTDIFTALTWPQYKSVLSFVILIIQLIFENNNACPLSKTRIIWIWGLECHRWYPWLSSSSSTGSSSRSWFASFRCLNSAWISWFKASTFPVTSQRDRNSWILYSWQNNKALKMNALWY